MAWAARRPLRLPAAAQRWVARAAVAAPNVARRISRRSRTSSRPSSNPIRAPGGSRGALNPVRFFLQTPPGMGDRAEKQGAGEDEEVSAPADPQADRRG